MHLGWRELHLVLFVSQPRRSGIAGYGGLLDELPLILPESRFLDGFHKSFSSYFKKVLELDFLLAFLFSELWELWSCT